MSVTLAAQFPSHLSCGHGCGYACGEKNRREPSFLFAKTTQTIEVRPWKFCGTSGCGSVRTQKSLGALRGRNGAACFRACGYHTEPSHCGLPPCRGGGMRGE